MGILNYIYDFRGYDFESQVHLSHAVGSVGTMVDRERKSLHLRRV